MNERTETRKCQYTFKLPINSFWQFLLACDRALSTFNIIVYNVLASSHSEEAASMGAFVAKPTKEGKITIPTSGSKPVFAI